MKSAGYVNHPDEYDSPVIILRGTARILAAATGLLLAYGAVYALEGITTRIPIAAARELATVSMWTVPWMLLFCSGLGDLAVATGKRLVLWLGSAAALLFFYYFDWHTSLAWLTKAAMPPLVVGAGLVPFYVKRIGFLFGLSSLAAGVAGGYVLYLAANTFLSSNTHFQTQFIAALIITFGIAGITCGLRNS